MYLVPAAVRGNLWAAPRYGIQLRYFHDTEPAARPKKCKEKVRFLKHTLCSAAAILPASVFGFLLHNVLSALLPHLPATILCGIILLGAEGLFLLALGLAQPRWVRLLVKKA